MLEHDQQIAETSENHAHRLNGIRQGCEQQVPLLIMVDSLPHRIIQEPAGGVIDEG